MTSKENEALNGIDLFISRLMQKTVASGYHLNPDTEFTKGLVEGLIANENRYGYASCPCRLATGNKDSDLDIICPCDYRDSDLTEHGACFCGLYVSESVLKGERKLTCIPERRPPQGQRLRKEAAIPMRAGSLAYPVWRCKVCGYLCAREEPPEVCPICKVKKERFEQFI